jgi:hypothetical protein
MRGLGDLEIRLSMVCRFRIPLDPLDGGRENGIPDLHAIRGVERVLYTVMVSTNGQRNEIEVFPATEDAQRVFLQRAKRCSQSPQGVWSEGYLLSEFQSLGYQDRQGRRRSVRARWLAAGQRRHWTMPGPRPTLLVWKRRPSDPVPDVDNDAGEHWALSDEGHILITPHTPASNATEDSEEAS